MEVACPDAVDRRSKSPPALACLQRRAVEFIGQFDERDYRKFLVSAKILTDGQGRWRPRCAEPSRIQGPVRY